MTGGGLGQLNIESVNQTQEDSHPIVEVIGTAIIEPANNILKPTTRANASGQTLNPGLQEAERRRKGKKKVDAQNDDQRKRLCNDKSRAGTNPTSDRLTALLLDRQETLKGMLAVQDQLIAVEMQCLGNAIPYIPARPLQIEPVEQPVPQAKPMAERLGIEHRIGEHASQGHRRAEEGDLRAQLNNRREDQASSIPLADRPPQAGEKRAGQGIIEPSMSPTYQDDDSRSTAHNHGRRIRTHPRSTGRTGRCNADDRRNQQLDEGQARQNQGRLESPTNEQVGGMDARQYLELKKELADLAAKVKPRRENDEQYGSALSPLATWMIKASPTGAPALMPDLKSYDGSTRAMAHLSHVETKMCMVSSKEEVMCKALISSLTGEALSWFQRLDSGSIHSWSQFRMMFLQRFAAAGQMKKTVADLSNLLQRKGESYIDFFNRFKTLLDQIDEEVTDREIVNCFRGALYSKGEGLDYELQIHKVYNRDELYKRVYDMSVAEDRRRYSGSRRVENTDPPKNNNNGHNGGYSGNHGGYKGKNRSRGTERDTERVPETFTPLTVSRTEIMNLVDLGSPPKMNPKNNRFRQNSNEYCRYHKEKGHTTEDCMSLKRWIQKLIDAGRLQEFVRREDQPARPQHERTEHADRTARKDLLVIREEESNTALKSKIYHLKKVPYTPPTYVAPDDLISFYPSELASNPLARQQFLVIPGLIDRCKATRILVDTGAARNVLYYDTYKQLGLPDSRLSPYLGRLEGFTNHRVKAKGLIDLEVDLGTHPRVTMATITFVVIDLVSDYHAILGAPGQATLGVVASIPHQRIKFPTRRGVGCVEGTASEFLDYVLNKNKQAADQSSRPSSSRITSITTMDVDPVSDEISYSDLVMVEVDDPGCDLTSKNNSTSISLEQLIDQEMPDLDREGKKVIKEIVIDSMDFRDGPEIKPVEELEEIIINPDYPEQKVKIGGQLSSEERTELIELLCNSLDVFAWRVEDMRGVKEEVAVHRLDVNPTIRYKSQRLRQCGRDKEKAIKEEVKKLVNAGIIREATYTTWLANVVMVKKSNGKWRMCVDFTDLNVACPKDCYPLPRIDKLVDSIAGHSTLSFLDAYSGYHQVRMHKDDIEKTTFQTTDGVYVGFMCPRHNPFLCNVIG